MSKQLTILVGTVSGNAEMTAEEMSDVLADSPLTITIRSMADLDASVFDGGGDFLVCTSTHGLGDVPDDALDFFEDVEDRKPDLSTVRFGVFCLGDSVYETFAGAGKQFVALLKGCGAKLVGEMGVHDASEGDLAEEVGADWIRVWVELLEG